MRNFSLKAVAAFSAILVLTACARPAVTTTEEMRPGQSLVIGKSYKAKRALIDSTWVVMSFDMIDPPGSEDAYFDWKGNSETYSADSALPGRYVLDTIVTIKEDIHYGLDRTYYEVRVGEGEAVYIGDIFYFGRGSFRIDDNEQAARAFFEEKFGDSGLTFTKRLMDIAVLRNPVLPK